MHAAHVIQPHHERSNAPELPAVSFGRGLALAILLSLSLWWGLAVLLARI
jgi:hypothetical protein